MPISDSNFLCSAFIFVFVALQIAPSSSVGRLGEGAIERREFGRSQPRPARVRIQVKPGALTSALRVLPHQESNSVAPCFWCVVLVAEP